MKKEDNVEVKLNDLYQEVILDHNRHPRNFGELEDCTTSSHGTNPLCGDDYHLYLKKDQQGIIKKISFKGDGCAISKAASSMMTEWVGGKSIHEAGRLKDAFLNLITKEHVSDQDRLLLGTLKIFEGVKQYPVRVKCAALIWRTLEDALKDPCEQKKEVSTEKEDHSGHAKDSAAKVQISAETTPNPNTIKFNVNQKLLQEGGSISYLDRQQAESSPLAKALFELDGLSGVMIGVNFVTITKQSSAHWQSLVPTIIEKLGHVLGSGPLVLSKDRKVDSKSTEEESLTVQRIRQILDRDIRPAVAMDGGDIEFVDYENGIVKLRMQGSCSHCPSATLTLKMGVENRLKELVPEVKSVEQVW